MLATNVGYQYQLVFGTNTIRAAASTVRGPKFWGTCYLCGNTAHSQNFCPLTRCRTCGAFGHTDKVCGTGLFGLSSKAG